MSTLEEGSKGIHIENAQETWLPFSILFCKADDAAISMGRWGKGNDKA